MKGIDKVYLIDEGQPSAEDRRLMLSYPYAKQFGDKLYIAYSSESAPGRNANNNDAVTLFLADAVITHVDSKEAGHGIF